MIIESTNKLLGTVQALGPESGKTNIVRSMMFWILTMTMVGWTFGLAGCGGDSSGGGAVVRKANPGPATNSSIIAVDCERQRAYVPLPDLDLNLHGRIAVLDLSVDPDVANPLVTTIDSDLIALPRSAGVDLASGTALVTMDDVLDTGVLLVINEADNSFTSALFPVGSRPAEDSGVVVDPANNSALISMSDSVLDCTNGVGGCTGEAFFNLGTGAFGPLLLSLEEVDNFGVDSTTNLSIGSADTITPELFAMNLTALETCVFDDGNIENLNADPDGIAVDPTTHVWVAGNFNSPIASVVNLNGATFVGSGTISCHLTEGGTSPNSINLATGSKASGMPGVAINPITHQAFLTAAAGPEISLLGLPKKPATQLKDSKIKPLSNSAIPDDPAGNPFVSAAFPYGEVIDSCNNLAYVVNSTGRFMAQVDLKTFEKHPEVISTALPAGTCAGVSTSFKCDNGNGVKFFPLPNLSSAPEKLPPQFTKANKRRK